MHKIDIDRGDEGVRRGEGCSFACNLQHHQLMPLNPTHWAFQQVHNEQRWIY